MTPIIRAGFNEQTAVVDLVVRSAEVGRDYLIAGEEDTVTTIIANTGTVQAAGFPVTLSIDGTQVADLTVTLDPGQTDTLAIPYVASATGMTTLTVEAVSADDIDPTNNTASTTQRVFRSGTTFSTVLIESGLVDKPIDSAFPTTRDTLTVAEDLAIVDMEVIIDSLTHTFDGDLDIFFYGPDGITNSELSTDNGSSGDNMIGTIFDDQAADPITSGTAPFTGFYRPETPLAVFVGMSSMGDWVLEITDDAGGDVGTLHNWSVMATVANEPPPVLDPPMGLSATAGNAEVSLEWQAPLAGGTVLLSYDDDSQEGSISIGSNGTTSSGDLAVRFTPGSYPATVIAYSVLLGTTADPVAHTQLPYTVWAGNGTSGPGAVLVSGNHVANRGGFETVDISAAGISIASDDFFIGFSETADSVAVLGWDTNQPSADRSWVNAPGLGIPWTTSGSIGATFDNNYMIRAIVMEGSGAASRIVELTPGGASRVLNVSEIKALKRSGLLEKSALSSGVAMDVTLDGSATESLPRSGGIVFGPGGSGNHNLIPEALGGYNVYRSDDGGTSFAMVASVDTPSVSYTDGGLSNGTTYYYYVTAVYDDGESVPSDTVSATPFDVDADIATHQTPEFVSAVTNRGNIGTLDDDLNGTRTPGFQWPIGTNQLFEGAIMIGASPDQVSDAARVISGGAQGFMDADFQFTTNVEVVASNSDSTVYVAGYDDSNAGLAPLADDGPNTPMPISVVQTTYSYTDADNSGYLIFKLDITNEGTSQLVDVLAGMYHDWDINNFSNNTGRVDLVELQLPGVNNDDSFLAEFAQLWDGSSSNSPHIGSVPLSQNVFQASRITDNAQEVFPGGAIPLSEANKYSYMLDRRATDPFGDPFGANDKSLVVGVGGSSSGYTIDPGQTITVGFAIVGGNDEADFVANGTAAIQKWISLGLDYYIDTSVGVDDPVAQVPTAFSLEQNYPNPFNPTTTLKYALKENVDVSLKVYNVLGQLVKTLVNGQQAAGWKEANWDGTNDLGARVSSGIYIYRLEAGDFVQSRKMILMK